jgi:phenylalanyl-tRNA synthetase beta chain
MTGLGFIETTNFILANETDHYQRMRRKTGKMIKLANPVSAEFSIVRNELLPSLVKNLEDNRHQAYPQRIFEVSDVIRIRDNAETRTERRLHVACVSSHQHANFTEIMSTSEALLTNLGLKNWKIKKTKHQSFLTGRSAAVYVKDKKIGVLGEIHPEVLNNFELENPTSAFEIDLRRLTPPIS